MSTRVGLRPRDMIGNIRPFSPTLRCLSRNVAHWTVEVGCKGEKRGGDVAAAFPMRGETVRSGSGVMNGA
ncbi:hypothetical protein VZT92_022551 [Zoarces viviparus]|uniref:Uncharacterized protein n=1 Tax=Zoarces viviparus TaxID=48416 RepID=A0AAW1ECD3_ZOAVI